CRFQTGSKGVAAPGRCNATRPTLTLRLAPLAPPAQADPASLNFDFYGCTGPTGTPAQFSAVRVSSSSSSLAFQLVDGRGVFVVLLFRDETVGIDTRPTFAPGLVANAVVTCSAVGRLFGHQLTVSGFFAWSAIPRSRRPQRWLREKVRHL